MTPSSEPARLTWRGVLDGLKLAPTLAVNSAIYGIIFGVLAAQAGLSAIESGIMSVTVFAGAAQLLIIENWARPVPLVSVVVGLMLVNSRHVLMAVAMRPHLDGLPVWKQLLASGVIVDDNWAIMMGKFEQGYRDAGYILGLAMLAIPCWTAMTVVGNMIGGNIADPRRWGFDFIIVALAIVILAGRWRGVSTLLPWGVAAGVAVAASHWLPGKGYIVAGAIAGSLAGLLRPDPGGPLKSALNKEAAR
ncbi:MAG: AzlC family ABC transporter permease [Rhodospirillaceae bacterium]|nr:AzlC family ABC transporter permease [Rhodospirillaceae bacterium]